MSDEKVNSAVLTGASLVAGQVMGYAATKSWEKYFEEKPPTQDPSVEINWKKAILWSVITGTVISSAKLGIRRLIFKINS